MFLFLNFFIIFFLSFVVPFFMYYFSFAISFKDYMSSCKLSSYECGFFLSKKVDVSFNIVFFSIVVMFVIFELEIIFFIMIIVGDFYSFFSFFVFFIYVVCSFYMELYLSKLLWFF